MSESTIRRRVGASWDALSRRYYHHDKKGRRDAYDRSYRVLMRFLGWEPPKAMNERQVMGGLR